MAIKKLYIFVEGNDDELFYRKIILPLFKNLYDDVEVLKYAQWKKQKVELFIQSIITLGFDYIFTADIDLCPTVNDKKRVIKSRFNTVENPKITIVIQEIESWYLAGLDEQYARKYKLKIPDNTNLITKEDFNMIYPMHFKSRIDFMYELLKVFSIETALNKNISFNYFYNKYINHYVQEPEN